MSHNTHSEVVMDEQTWKELSSESRDWIIYNTVVNQGRRITHIENRTNFHKMYAVLGGLIGSVASFFGAKFVHP